MECQDKENKNKGKCKGGNDVKAVNNKGVLKQYYEQEEFLIQSREQEIIDVEKYVIYLIAIKYWVDGTRMF